MLEDYFLDEIGEIFLEYANLRAGGDSAAGESSATVSAEKFFAF